jgi:superfamily I DNA/RNA helicase
MKATPEQQAAIQTQGRPLLVDAGAGTGKTWVLVERCIPYGQKPLAIIPSGRSWL